MMLQRRAYSGSSSRHTAQQHVQQHVHTCLRMYLLYAVIMHKQPPNLLTSGFKPSTSTTKQVKLTSLLYSTMAYDRTSSTAIGWESQYYSQGAISFHTLVI
jgi:hypothetical protein